MYDLTPSQVFGLCLLIPCVAGLSYLIGYGRARARFVVVCDEIVADWHKLRGVCPNCGDPHSTCDHSVEIHHSDAPAPYNLQSYR